MYFNLGIRLSTAKQTTTSTCTCISIQPVQCAKTVLLSSYLLQCIPLHYYALLLFVEPCSDHIKLAHNCGAELFVNLVAVATEAGHIGGMAQVRELLINKYFHTGMLFIYLSLNGNEISSVIRPAQFYIHVHTSTCLSMGSSPLRASFVAFFKDHLKSTPLQPALPPGI